MIKVSNWIALCGAGVLALAGTVRADSAKNYQVTGPVLEMNDNLIVVEKKKKERWEINRNADTKINGDVKVGGEVTVYYTMTATKVEAKGEKAAKKP